MPPIHRTLIAGDYRSASMLVDGQYFGQTHSGEGEYDASQYDGFNDPSLIKQLPVESLKKMGLPKALFSNLKSKDPMYAEKVRQLNSLVRAQQLIGTGREVTLVGIDPEFRAILAQDKAWQAKYGEHANIGGHNDPNDPAAFPRTLQSDGAISAKKVASSIGSEKGGAGGFPSQHLYNNSPKEAEAYYRLASQGINAQQLREQHGLDTSKLPDGAKYANIKNFSYNELILNKLDMAGIDANQYPVVLREMRSNPAVLNKMVMGNAVEVFKQEMDRRLKEHPDPAGETAAINEQVKQLKAERDAIAKQARESFKFTPDPKHDASTQLSYKNVAWNQHLEKYPKYAKLGGEIDARQKETMKLDELADYRRQFARDLDGRRAKDVEREEALAHAQKLDSLRSRLPEQRKKPLPIPPSKQAKDAPSEKPQVEVEKRRSSVSGRDI